MQVSRLEGDTSDGALIASPCVDRCHLDRNRRWCIGCGRTASEIGRWGVVGNAEKLVILGKLPARLAIMRPGISNGKEGTRQCQTR